MSIVTQISNFPGTIAALSNPPRLDAATMQQALQQDTQTLWGDVQALITELNGNVSTSIDHTSTNNEIAGAKAVYDLVLSVISGGGTITPALIGAAELDADGKVRADQASAAILEKTAAFTLALTDAGRIIEVTAASSVTCTVPANASVAFPVGTEIKLAQMGAGAVKIAGATGVNILSNGNLDETRGQYEVARLKKIDTNTWLLEGALGPVKEMYKSLWTGTWSSSDITVDGLSDYNLFLVRVAIKSTHTENGTCIFAAIGGEDRDSFRGVGGAPFSTSAISFAGIMASRSGDTLTFSYCLAHSTTGNDTPLEVIEIIGIM